MSDEDLVHKTKETYDGSFTADILEQYKIYVQSAENVSSRRIATSRYLLTLSAALLAVYGIQLPGLNQSYWTLTVPATGMIVSVLWYCLIRSYRNLNDIKFQIIHDLEQLAGLNQSYWTLTVPATGMIVSVLWYCLIRSYRNLNDIKFQIIHDLEQYLPVALYKHEWKKAGQGSGKFYTAVTGIERWIPILFICLHALLAVILGLANTGILVGILS